MPESTYLTFRTAAGTPLPEHLRHAAPYARALNQARALIQARGACLIAARAAHAAQLRDKEHEPTRSAAAEAWREAECIALAALDAADATPPAGTRLDVITP